MTDNEKTVLLDLVQGWIYISGDDKYKKPCDETKKLKKQHKVKPKASLHLIDLKSRTNQLNISSQFTISLVDCDLDQHN